MPPSELNSAEGLWHMALGVRLRALAQENREIDMVVCTNQIPEIALKAGSILACRAAHGLPAWRLDLGTRHRFTDLSAEPN